MSNTFLNAEWRKLAMANYAVDPESLRSYLPAGTALDFWNDTCYVSLVGFMFLNTRVLGIPVPFHINFEEVNLRFYVRYRDNGEWKRGVVFISEIVPKAALTLVANTLYGEHYRTLPMRHAWKSSDQSLEVSYQWKTKQWNTFGVTAQSKSVPMAVGSEEEFITEHFWGYTQRSRGRTSEYGVEHPRWEVYPALSWQIEVDFAELYGKSFAHLNALKPKSVFLAEGSAIKVLKGRTLF